LDGLRLRQSSNPASTIQKHESGRLRLPLSCFLIGLAVLNGFATRDDRRGGDRGLDGLRLRRSSNHASTISIQYRCAVACLVPACISARSARRAAGYTDRCEPALLPTGPCALNADPLQCCRSSCSSASRWWTPPPEA
jgi:hypothetical protein